MWWSRTFRPLVPHQCIRYPSVRARSFTDNYRHANNKLKHNQRHCKTNDRAKFHNPLCHDITSRSPYLLSRHFRPRSATFPKYRQKQQVSTLFPQERQGPKATSPTYHLRPRARISSQRRARNIQPQATLRKV